MSPEEALEVIKNIPCGTHCLHHNCDSCKLHEAYKVLEKRIKGFQLAQEMKVAVIKADEAFIERILSELDIISDRVDWYESQDLIRREDVLNVYNSDLCLEFDREMCESTPNCRCCNIMRIPKAEYKGEDKYEK